MSEVMIKSFSDLISLREIINNINKANIDISVSSLFEFYDNSHKYSFNMTICRFVYDSFAARLKDFDMVIAFLNLIEKEINKYQVKIFDVFSQFLRDKDSQESNYLLAKMIEKGLIRTTIAINKGNLYFSHYKSLTEFHSNEKLKSDRFWKYFSENIANLSKNDWELHKKLVEEGVNPNKIAKAIRYDDLAKLQEIASQQKFDFNQIIEPSLYERCSYINQDNVSLINYAAFFGSIKCFRYLLTNEAKLDNTGKYAVASGNLEIIHLCEQNHSSFEGAYETAIEFHQNDIFYHIKENNLAEMKDESILEKICIMNDNYEILRFLKENNMSVSEALIKEAIKTGVLFLAKHFLEGNKIFSSALAVAVGSKNIELVKYILKRKNIDINAYDFDIKILMLYNIIWIFFYRFKTALMYAARIPHPEILELLLCRINLNINLKDIYFLCIMFDFIYLIFIINIWNLFK